MSNLTRPAAFGNADASAPKRRKLAPNEYDSENDDGDALFDEIATLPLDQYPGVANHLAPPATPPRAQPAPSPPTAVAATQPTQILPTVPDHSPPGALPPTVQVPASSPYRNGFSPSPTTKAPISRLALQPNAPVRPFDFYPAVNGAPDNFSHDGPQYVASSSDGEGSDKDIQPAFPSNTTKNSGYFKPPRYQSVNPGLGLPRVPESPASLMRQHTSQFAYVPARMGSSVPMGGHRLDSLTRRPAFSPPVGATPRFQTHPECAQTVGDIAINEIENTEYRINVSRMKSVLPTKPYRSLLNALIQKKGNYEDAMDLLISQDEIIDLTTTTDDRDGRRNNAPTRTNRAQGAGRRKITDKWSSTQVQRNAGSSPAAAADPKPKRKLVRGSASVSRDRSASPLVPIEIDDESDSAAGLDDDSEDERELERRVLKYINGCSVKELSDIACTTEEIAEVIISQRPFSTLDTIREVSSSTCTTKAKKGRGNRARPIGDKVVDVCVETMRGYEAVDTLIARVEALGKPIAESIKAWGVDIFGGNDSAPGELEITDVSADGEAGSLKDSGIGTPTDVVDGSNAGSVEDGDDIRGNKRDKHGQILKVQPSNMAENVTLKDYQLVGVSWLNLLYEKNLSCILADEMGLGKTCQVVAFLAHLLSKGITGPHLVVVPSSTLENWLREFKHFCPALRVEPYYGSQAERPAIRASLSKDRGWNVLVTTYQLATGDKLDRGFLKSMAFNVCVYDEGHMLKNSQSNRYDSLMKLPADFRLLLTGTPLQNNLQELASLLAFILPNVFVEKKDELASIFKYKAKTTDDDESNNALLSMQRIKRARAMMTPFVLRRKKQQVLKHLPGKTTRVQYCNLNKLQKELYDENIRSAREALEARAAGKKANKTSSNVMMQLRKAAIHPLLFRTYYTNEKIKKMSKDIMKEDAYKNNDQMAILEDMEVMNDLELNRLCGNFPRTLGKYELKKSEWMNSGKVEEVRKVLEEMKVKGDRVLLFSQFTQMLDILELVLTDLDLGYLRIDGSTPVDMRQDLIDQYHQQEDIMVFLLSTKAGGFGINLACANKVVIFDSSFNPHDDVQASDRAHRVGQTREVEVIRLITRNTIEEQILQLANTKLALDQSISAADEKALEGKGEELVAKMLLETETPKINGKA